eukprot:TRINITY_DN22600_c0_g1_i3.p2 TRINITY_DN22600_c0_g1~~TRINITY_DN22600_c0_g1_i3.p2  ORF type:complete len:183 (-),score=24.39 TRINITY_DN22600_c0_g1_i3:403-951(-)
MLARRLDAECVVEAVSGYGVTDQGWGGEVQSVLDWTLGFAREHRWNYSAWTPDAVILLIGPNDFTNPELNASHFRKRYFQLLVDVRGNYGGAAVLPKLINVCAGSINGMDACLEIEAAGNLFNQTWGGGSYHVEASQEVWDRLNGGGYNGCDGHYSAVGHEALTHHLGPQISAILGWDWRTL